MATVFQKRKAGTSLYLVLVCIVASIGGLNFGYAAGCSVLPYTASFQTFFFKTQSHFGIYLESCRWDFHFMFAAFTSSLYLSALLACFTAACFVTKVYGMRISIIVGGFCYLAGAVLTSAAQNVTMIILGRVMTGVGAGFGSQAIPIYITEMATPKHRGALISMFQLAITIGTLCANLVIVATGTISGQLRWRVRLVPAGVPAILMVIGGIFLPETPRLLIAQGHYEQSRRLLTKLRGTHEVDAEYEMIKEATRSQQANTSYTALKRPFRKLLESQSRPQLIMAVIIPFFQQFTGMNAILSFTSLGGSEYPTALESYMNMAVISSVNVFATLIPMANVDRWGRRPFFLEGGFQMLVCLVLMGATQWTYSGVRLLIMCLYVSAFAWSWGPLGWLLPSEALPVETRSAGQALTVSVNMFSALVIEHAIPAIYCKLDNERYTCLFFAAWVLAMTVFVFWFVPETKKVPLEEMNKVIWGRHWFWKRFVPDFDQSLAASSMHVQQHQA